MTFVPPIITPGLVADLDGLRAFIGATSTRDDQLLDASLAVAWQWVIDRVYPDQLDTPDCHTAVMLLASRIYKRRQSPEGVAGFSGDGLVVRILASDPDVRALLERLTDQTNVGIG